MSGAARAPTLENLQESRIRTPSSRLDVGAPSAALVALDKPDALEAEEGFERVVQPRVRTFGVFKAPPTSGSVITCGQLCKPLGKVVAFLDMLISNVRETLREPLRSELSRGSVLVASACS